MRSLLAALVLCAAATASAQTDINLSAYAALNPSTTYQGTSFSTNDSAGLQAGFRHISWPWWGYEASYSFNQFNLKQPYSQEQNQHSITGDYVASFPVLNLRPFALAGGGLAYLSGGNTAHGILEYGVGTDVAVVPHVGLRFQFREQFLGGSVLPGSSTTFLHEYRPMAGAYFKF